MARPSEPTGNRCTIGQLVHASPAAGFVPGSSAGGEAPQRIARAESLEDSISSGPCNRTERGQEAWTIGDDGRDCEAYAGDR